MGAESILVGVVCTQYTGASILMALGATVFIFLGMTLYACTTKHDFTGMGPYLFGIMLAFCGVGFALMLFQMFPGTSPFAVHAMYKVYAGLGAVLFTVYIVYDTQLIIGEFNGHKIQFGIDDYVFAAL